ncbi:hypothetical protein GQX73_g8077 [Xylaria multiplex]|uniref:Uncharacterized protein n=1 Tax=Xylaria multiplex TaxID=323545 RepID=A0A7C8MNC6_9PEZI|nr:hypothetical protein GQX73_g8077 [Xylaria multiplex]
MPPSAVKTTLVVGIDFGTTFSGVSWLTCKAGSAAGQPEVISLWETATDNIKDNSDSKKVPSKLYNDKDGKLWWGFNIPAGVETIDWFKLLLLNAEDLQNHLQDSAHLNDARKSLQKLQKSAVQLVGEYLKNLWDYSMEQICNEKGANLVDRMRFHVVLSVPAIWTDYARDRMRTAAAIAGILKDRGKWVGKTTLSFVSEPEAAAIATMPELEDRTDLQTGDSFVVVDAGGGTVDVISYKVNKLEPLSVSECVEGEGALCGGTFLDKEFESFLKDAIGKASWNKMNKSDIRRMMNNEWEHGIKGAFKGQPGYYTVELPSRTQRAPLQFSSSWRSEEIQPVFDKVVSQIGELAKKQIDAIKAKTSRLPKLVILVGGFGRSPYLLKYMRGHLGNRITVLQARGDKPWTAICRGAALSGAAELGPADGGHQLLVQSRIARSNYGWSFVAPYVKGVHDPRDKYWNEVRRGWYAKNQMEWVIKRGEDISLKGSKTYPYNIDWEAGVQGHQLLAHNIFTSNDLNPPSRMQDHVRKVASINYRTSKPVEETEMVYDWETSVSYRTWLHEWKVVVSGASFDISLVAEGKEEKLDKIFINTF